MIYRLFRKEVSVRSALDLNKPELSESLFIEEISRMIKLVRKREKLYLELEEGVKGLQEGQRECIELQGESQEMLGVLRGFAGLSFFGCKAYLYTAYMRLSELADKARAKYRVESRTTLQRNYDEMKKTITELYNRQMAQEKYQVVQLFEIVLKQQTQRIAPFLPKKKPAPLQPINNSRKILDQLKQPIEGLDIRKKSASTEMFKPSQIKIEDIISKKLIQPELATSKRIQQRKKEKVRPRVINLFRLYDILDIRPPAMDRPYLLKEELLQSMNERNQRIREVMQRWEKRYVGRTAKKERR